MSEENSPEDAPVAENNEHNTTLSEEKTEFQHIYIPKILPPFDIEEHSKGNSTAVLNTTKQNLEAIQRIPDLTPIGYKKRVEYAIGQLQEERDREIACRDDPYRDMNFFLEVAISTVILMAAGQSNIPVSNYMYTEHYLNSIKTDSGDHPPNISGFLAHLKYRKQEEKIDYGKRYKFRPPPNVFLVRTKPKQPHLISLDRTVHTLKNTTLSHIRSEAAREFEKQKEETPETVVDPTPEEEKFHDAEGLNYKKKARAEDIRSYVIRFRS